WNWCAGTESNCVSYDGQDESRLFILEGDSDRCTHRSTWSDTTCITIRHRCSWSSRAKDDRSRDCQGASFERRSGGLHDFCMDSRSDRIVRLRFTIKPTYGIVAFGSVARNKVGFDEPEVWKDDRQKRPFHAKDFPNRIHSLKYLRRPEPTRR